MEANILYMKKYENNFNLLSVSPESLHSNSLYVGHCFVPWEISLKLFASLLQCTYKQNTMNNVFFFYIYRRLK